MVIYSFYAPSTAGCVVANYQNGGCQLVAPPFAPTFQSPYTALFPPGSGYAPVPVPVAPKAEQHGPYVGGGGWPTVRFHCVFLCLMYSGPYVGGGGWPTVRKLQCGTALYRTVLQCTQQGTLYYWLFRTCFTTTTVYHSLHDIHSSQLLCATTTNYYFYYYYYCAPLHVTHSSHSLLLCTPRYAQTVCLSAGERPSSPRVRLRRGAAALSYVLNGVIRPLRARHFRIRVRRGPARLIRAVCTHAEPRVLGNAWRESPGGYVQRRVRARVHGM